MNTEGVVFVSVYAFIAILAGIHIANRRERKVIGHDVETVLIIVILLALAFLMFKHFTNEQVYP